jgi:tetratricopeptide (TPR) repeat protein
LLAVGKWEESGKHYRAAVKQHADCAEAYYGLGRIATARGKPAEAIEYFRKACELFPAYGPSHYALAQVYRRIGQSQQSEEQLSLYKTYMLAVPPTNDPLRDAVAELNQSAAPHLRLGLAFEQVGKIKEAVAEHEKALEIDPSEVQAHVNLVSLYGRLGEVAKAEQHYHEAVRLSPDRADAYYAYGVLLLGQRREVEAQQALEHALQINPLYAEAQNNLGTLLEQQGKLDEARQQFEAALANRPGYRIARFHLARILVNQRKYDEAIQHFLKILTPEDEDTPRYLYALAATYARAGDRESALKYMRKAHEEAASRHQSQLLTSIDNDLRTLEQAGRQP